MILKEIDMDDYRFYRLLMVGACVIAYMIMSAQAIDTTTKVAAKAANAIVDNVSKRDIEFTSK